MPTCLLRHDADDCVGRRGAGRKGGGGVKGNKGGTRGGGGVDAAAARRAGLCRAAGGGVAAAERPCLRPRGLTNVGQSSIAPANDGIGVSRGGVAPVHCAASRLLAMVCRTTASCWPARRAPSRRGLDAKRLAAAADMVQLGRGLATIRPCEGLGLQTGQRSWGKLLGAVRPVPQSKLAAQSSLLAPSSRQLPVTGLQAIGAGARGRMRPEWCS